MKTEELQRASAIAGETRLIPIGELHESPWNPRQYYPEAEMKELVESMRQAGYRQWLPLLVRPCPEGGYEIGAGHRRRRAAAEAGIDLIPCTVQELSDEQFLDVLNFDNGGRDDVHPLQEAAGWSVWMQKTGHGVKDIAARIGQSIEYVYQRLQYASLIKPARALFLDGKFTASHAILIARQPERYQIAAIEFCTPAWDADRDVSVRQLAEWIKKNCMLSLRAGDFDPADETLVSGAGACTSCPKRSGTNPELFSDLDDPDICTDPHCYRDKLIAFEVRKPKPAPPVAAAPKPPAAPKRDEPKPISADESRPDPAAEKQKEREAEAQRIRRLEERADKVYAKAVDAVLEKIVWPMSRDDMAAVLAFLVGAFESNDELADKFAISNTGGERWRDIVAVAKVLPAQKIARMIVAGILLDVGMLEGRDITSQHVLAQFAKRYKVDLAKIAAQVDAEMNPKPPAAKAAKPAKPASKTVPPPEKRSPAKKKNWKDFKKQQPVAAKAEKK